MGHRRPVHHFVTGHSAMSLLGADAKRHTRSMQSPKINPPPPKKKNLKKPLPPRVDYLPDLPSILGVFLGSFFPFFLSLTDHSHLPVVNSILYRGGHPAPKTPQKPPVKKQRGLASYFPRTVYERLPCMTHPRYHSTHAQACDFTWRTKGAQRLAARLPDGTPQNFNVSYNKDNFLTRILSGYGSHPLMPLDQNDLKRAKVRKRSLQLYVFPVSGSF